MFEQTFMKLGLLISVILIGLFVVKSGGRQKKGRQTKSSSLSGFEEWGLFLWGLRRQVKREIKPKLYKQVAVSIILNGNVKGYHRSKNPEKAVTERELSFIYVHVGDYKGK